MKCKQKNWIWEIITRTNLLMDIYVCLCLSPSSSAFRFFKLSLYKFLPFINTKQHNIKEKKRLKKKREKNIPLQAKTSHNPIHKT